MRLNINRMTWNINRGEYDGFTLDVQVWKRGGDAQARYCVHGTDDVLWTDDIEDVLAYLRAELLRIEEDAVP